jgi:phytoene dehydrogenase-like protein
MDDFAVVGGGIGGSAIAVELSREFDVTLYEKEPYLGGCSSTFRHRGNYYNSAATTFAANERGGALYEFFDRNQIELPQKELTFSHIVRIGDKEIKRYKAFDRFIDEINRAIPHTAHRSFYQEVRTIINSFYEIDSYFYSDRSVGAKLISLPSFFPVLKRFYPYLFRNAKSYIEGVYGELTQEHRDYLDNQVRIVAQAKLEEINFITAALALGYHFSTNFYLFGGMGAAFDAMRDKIDTIKMGCEITQIERVSDRYLLKSRKEEFEAKSIVLNSSIFESSKLFHDKEVNNYFNKYQSFDSKVGAFMLYMQIKAPYQLAHHYQIILEENLPYCTSNSIFISIGDIEDEKMRGSITVSVHSAVDEWNDGYKEKKQHLESIIVQIVTSQLGLELESIESAFSATPMTFKRYINRSSLGGIPAKESNLFYKLPSNITPIKGLYLVGDTSFAAQGWIGVMIGVRNLRRELCKR